MIKKLELEIGKARGEEGKTKLICRLIIDGEKCGRLSLTHTTATHLQIILARGLAQGLMKAKM